MRQPDRGLSEECSGEKEPHIQSPGTKESLMSGESKNNSVEYGGENYRVAGGEAAEENGGLINHIKGFECYSKFMWKPSRGYV